MLNSSLVQLPAPGVLFVGQMHLRQVQLPDSSKHRHLLRNPIPVHEHLQLQLLRQDISVSLRGPVQRKLLEVRGLGILLRKLHLGQVLVANSIRC